MRIGTAQKSEDGMIKLRQQAADLIPSVIAKQDQRLQKFAEQHEDDVSTYKFECRRHGDWLAVFITRGKPVVGRDFWDHRSHKCSHVINLAPCRTISVISGHAADRDGKTGFTVCHTNDGSLKVTEYNDSREVPYPRYNMIHVLIPKDDKHSGMHMWSGDSSRAHFNGIHVPDCARAAEDDRIEFSGTGVTLFTPYGLGEHIRDVIVAELGRGFAEQDTTHPHSQRE
jgi:hypothetical protein